jgi:hypothetical protein
MEGRRPAHASGRELGSDHDLVLKDSRSGSRHFRRRDRPKGDRDDGGADAYFLFSQESIQWMPNRSSSIPKREPQKAS